MGVVEAAHTVHDSLDLWTAGVVEAVAKVLDFGFGTVGRIVRRSSNGYQSVLSQTVGMTAEIDGFVRGSVSKMLEHTDASALDQLYCVPQYVATWLTLRERLPQGMRNLYAPFLELVGARDCLSLLPQPGGGYYMALSSPHDGSIELGPAARVTLHRLALHIEAGLALQLFPGTAVALLSPDGSIVHAEGAGSRREVSQSLRAHVRAIERRRARSVQDGSNAIDGWTALVSGRFGFAERTAPDGKRHYVAFESRPPGTRLRRFTSRETRVVELAARGLSGKLTAYALGLTQQAVSEALASAALKAGCSSRTALVRLASCVRREALEPTTTVTLTRAEREVLSLLQRGWSNERIARARGRSVRTVANQVAALLRKAGLTSRAAAAALIKPNN